MKVTTVRFGTDLWSMLEREAAEVGVSVSQYIREAALTRAAAAAALRGQDPFEHLAGAADGAEQRALASDRSKAAVVRAAAVARKGESEATKAQSAQAIRRAHELAADVEALLRAAR